MTVTSTIGRRRSVSWRSLRVRLPLLISALVAVFLTAFLWVAFRQVETALVDAGGARAQGAADQLATLLMQSGQQRLGDLQRAARSGAVRDYLRKPSDSRAIAARDRLASLTSAGQAVVEVWDSARQPLISVGGATPGGQAMPAHVAAASRASNPGLSLFRISQDVVFWDALAEVQEELPDGSIAANAPRMGYVFTRRPLTSASASDVIARLVGHSAIVAIGNQTGDVWTDLSKVIPAPPIDLKRGGVAQYRSSSGEQRLGASALIRGTSWAVWVEFPRPTVVAPARMFLTRMLIFGLFFVVAAAAVARAVSARITTPLQELTDAAEAIAVGHYPERVHPRRKDEIGRLGAAFNSMAEQVHGVQRQLEARVEQRTAKLVEAGAQLEKNLAELDDARQEIDRFFAFSLDMLCIAGMDGYFKRLNPAWSEVLGWTDAELRDQPYLDFVHPEDRQDTIRRAAQLAQGESAVMFENRYRCRDGSYRWLQWKAFGVRDRDVIYAAARDISEQKASDLRIRSLNDQLEERVSELHALTGELEAFSYSVSHDLRAPLRHVAGFASLLMKSATGRLEETESRYVQTIVEAAGRMGRLIDDLLSFSRMGRTALERRRVALDDVVREALQEVQGGATGREIVWRVAKLPEVEGDAAMLRLVFVNLLSNAIKYTAGRPRPTIEVAVEGDADDETVIAVRDNGVGFDMTYAHKLFGVFQRLHSSDEFEGTGIGLANVRRIVNRHGGRVWAESVAGRGATFFIALPTTREVHA
jgi:PAS domain S-box-containing protein